MTDSAAGVAEFDLELDAGILEEPDAVALDLDEDADLVCFGIDVDVEEEAGFDSILTPFSLIRSAYEPRALNTEVVFCSSAGVVGMIVGEEDDGITSA